VLRSLRFRITSLAMLIVVTVLAGAGVMILETARSHLERQVDRACSSSIRLGHGGELG
jgi:hypothetical protein